MPIARILTEFQASVGQCESLIANAHKTYAGGEAIFPDIDRDQITRAGFLNLFIAWEFFLESSLAELMIGAATNSGNFPVRYVSPPSAEAARALLKGTRSYFDYGNHQNMILIVKLLFEEGYPYEPHLSAIYSDLDDIRTMRNSSAHISSTTQAALDALALRIFGGPQVSINLYQLLTSIDPRSAGGETVFVTYKNKLTVTAELISEG